jgi:hypothetical protein
MSLSARFHKFEGNPMHQLDEPGPNGSEYQPDGNPCFFLFLLLVATIAIILEFLF